MSAGNDIYDTHGRGKRNRILWSLPSTHRYLGRSVLISHSCAKSSHENCPGSSTSRSGQAFGLRWQKSRKSKAYSAAHNISTQHQHTASAHSTSTQHQHTAPASMRSQGMSVPGWPAGCLRVAPHLTSPHLWAAPPGWPVRVRAPGRTWPPRSLPRDTSRAPAGESR
jgi:hypothetical protein